MLVFLSLGIVGAVALIICLLLDGILDVFDFGGDGPLSLTTISAFISIFGFSALSASALGLGTGGSLISGAAAGLIGATASFWLTRALKGMEANGHEESSLAGLYGTVTTPIPEGRLGEISVLKSGERLHISARSATAVGRGKRVLIESVISSSSVFVVDPEAEQAEAAKSSFEDQGDFD